MNIKWNSQNYKEGFSFVSEYGEAVTELITLPKGSLVCDLGCGCGNLTNMLSQTGYNVIGVDASADMLKTAKETYPNLTFANADALSFTLPQKADGIFSNAVFHWIDKENQERLIENVAKNLKTGGELVCEFGGKGCAEAVHSTLREIFESHGLNYIYEFYFPTIGEYAPILEKYGLRVTFATLFDRPTPQKEGLRGWIEMFDKKPFENVPKELKDQIISEAENSLKPILFTGQGWFVDYVRIRLKAVKI